MKSGKNLQLVLTRFVLMLKKLAMQPPKTMLEPLKTCEVQIENVKQCVLSMTQACW